MSKYVTYTDRDEIGKFSFTGLVESKTKDTMTIRTVEGVMTVPADKCTALAKVRAHIRDRINDYVAMDNGDKPIKKAKVPTSTKAPKARKTATRKSDGSSKKDLAIKLYTENKGLTRKEMINVFVTDLGMTTAGASTYYAVAKKAVG